MTEWISIKDRLPEEPKEESYLDRVVNFWQEYQKP